MHLNFEIPTDYPLICGMNHTRSIVLTHLENFISIQNISHCVPTEFAIKFDTVKSGWSIVYMEGSQVIIFKHYCISFSQDLFRLNKQCRP